MKANNILKEVINKNGLFEALAMASCLLVMTLVGSVSAALAQEGQKSEFFPIPDSYKVEGIPPIKNSEVENLFYDPSAIKSNLIWSVDAINRRLLVTDQKYSVYLLDTPMAQPVQLLQKIVPNSVKTRPDGTSFAYTSDHETEDSYQLYLYDFKEKASKKLTNLTNKEHSVDSFIWSERGDSLFFVKVDYESKTTKLCRTDLQTEKCFQANLPGIWEVMDNMENKLLLKYWKASSSQHLYLFDTQSEKLTPLDEQGNCRRGFLTRERVFWTSDGHDRCKNQPCILSRNLKNNALSQVKLPANLLNLNEVKVSPGGTHLLIQDTQDGIDVLRIFKLRKENPKKKAEMAIANRYKIKVALQPFNWTASRFIKTGLLIFSVFFSFVNGQSGNELKELVQAQSELDNGNYLKAVELAGVGVEKAKKQKNNSQVSQGLDIAARSKISLAEYESAFNALDEALRIVSEDDKNAYRKALIFIRFAWLMRSQRRFAEAFDYSKKAVAAAPENRQIQAEHYLNIGRILFASGYDVSAIIWLEKAEKLLETENTNAAKIDVYRFLSLVWSSKLNYQTALKYAEKCILFAEKTQFKYKHRQGLFDQATILSASGQEKRAILILEKGLKISVEENDSYQGGKFLTSLLLHSLAQGDINKASAYLDKLEKLDAGNRFSFEIKLGKARIIAFQGQSDVSEKLFAELDKQENTSDFILPYWRITIAEKNQNWERVIKFNTELLDLTIKHNFRDDLPNLYFNFANAYFNLGQTQKALENLEKSLALIEEIRLSENSNLALGLYETYHSAYRLLTQIRLVNPQASFEMADFLKARLLKDRIDNSPVKNSITISEASRKKLEEISLKLFDDETLRGEIESYEKRINPQIPELNLQKPDFTGLDKVPELENSAIVSYFFTLDKKLLASVWEKGKAVQTVELSISEDELEKLAAKTHQNIKTGVFFKRDGKAIYEKLLKPLAVTSGHLIIVPDKALWKIPFQALSPDGEKYLIEEKLVSYAPSVSILLEQLKNPEPVRQSLQAFANSNYENRILQNVNAEAISVAEIYNSKPLLNATITDYERNSEQADILHFSMHAEVDSEQPLESFLGFRKFGKDDGRLTVEDHLKIKLKKGSLVFLASCDTNNVLNGEGLVSLAWAMMGSGATTVISAQWEANDKSTEIFTKAFYRHYKQGNSSAEAMQKASLELIKNKSNNMHEPYYWADFTLNGDFR